MQAMQNIFTVFSGGVNDFDAAQKQLVVDKTSDLRTQWVECQAQIVRGNSNAEKKQKFVHARVTLCIAAPKSPG